MNALLISNGKKLFPDKKEESPGKYVFAWEKLCEATVRFSPEGDFEASWEAKADGEFAFVLIFELSEEEKGEIFVPGVWYRGNLCGKGLFPRKSLSETWLFLETRMPVPGFVYSGGKKEGLLLTVCGAKEKFEVSSVGFSNQALFLMIPGKEYPFSYRGKTLLKDTSEEPLKTIRLKKGESYSRKFALRKTCAGSGPEVFEHLARSLVQEPASRPGSKTWEEYRETKLVRLLNMVRRSSDGKAYVVMGEGNGETQSTYEFTSACFLVRSLEAAVCFFDCDVWAQHQASPALKRALQRIRSLFGDGTSLKDLGALIGEYFLACEVRPGVFADNISLKTGEKGGYLGIGEHPEYRFGVNARTNGEAMIQYLGLYERTGKKEFLELPLRVANFYVKRQLEDGSYGRWYSQEGKLLDRKGANGAHMARLILNLLPYAKCREFEESAERALKFYAELSLKGEFFGDTLDADCCDKEAGLALAELFLDALEKGKGNPSVRKALLKAASFTLSWIWQYDSFIDPKSPLGRKGFKTKGMSSVSVAHHHLDFFGMKIAVIFLRLWKITGDSFWKTEALMASSACLQLIEKGDLSLGRGPEFYGWQPEQVNHTCWDYFSRSRYADGNYDIDIAWVHALGLGAYLEMERAFPGIL